MVDHLMGLLPPHASEQVYVIGLVSILESTAVLSM